MRLRAAAFGVLLAVLIALCGPLPRAGAWSAANTGYAAIDSEESGGPIYMWVDIAVTGTNVGLTQDNEVAPVTLPFPFEFGGNSYPTVGVNSNGFVEFGGSTTTLTEQNTIIPTANPPSNMIAAFWDDLDITRAPGTARVVTQTMGSAPNRRFVISYLNVPRRQTDGPPWFLQSYTFQIILYEQGGCILVQYHGLNDDGGPRYGSGLSATVGIEYAGGTEGIQYLFDGAPASNSLYYGLAVGFRPVLSAPAWTTAPPVLIQSDSPGGPAEGPGYANMDHSMSFRRAISNVDPYAYIQLEVEIKSIMASFDGTGTPIPLVYGNICRGFGLSEATASGLPDGLYKWRARTIDRSGGTAWEEFDPDPGADFTVGVLSAPTGGGDSPNGWKAPNDRLCRESVPLSGGAAPPWLAAGLLALALARAAGRRLIRKGRD